ncbi:epsilon family phenol-soluble modulin [Staphylococcus chromogenes]|uniref:Epsilon family phenol-soluble modulin n=1 Tax=Staphylococcus chromogenes TaxID=46126 RepID=A0AAX0ZIB1_STACR|nr:epsilon family phenol-soluble modulin [Staphylococcus chromogenes]MBW6089119.1 epsilon family phenol-soluble modulin [Staphylococcus chromogenes]MCE4961421.1 epsilon family phenol-soluble modulin [Staphylococcus chromogenes]PTF29896.1 epsilon family phenol-soluble modulin [Staphylococcus chromogenes]PTF43961.1 epsilon family phenol-soluble modulin [Staphylococcus chromogenes]
MEMINMFIISLIKKVIEFFKGLFK